MGKKKKLEKIIASVQEILGSDVTKKKLKKAKSLRRFVEKMEVKRMQLIVEIERGEGDPDREALAKRHIETLEKQIVRAKKILKEMDD